MAINISKTTPQRLNKTPERSRVERQSLSAAKKGPTKGLRNVLVQPQETIWPILRNEVEKKELHGLLVKLLPKKENTKKTMSWTQLRKMSKEERSALRKDSQPQNSEMNPCMNSVILGINAVTRAFEKDNVCSVLLDSNIDPLFLVKHIVVMGQNKSIPVLVIPFLKTVTLSTIGFACGAMALKTPLSKEGHFYPLHESVTALADKLLQAKTCIQLFSEELASDDITENIPQPIEKFSLSKSVYLNRSSNNERAFVPPSSSFQEKSDQNLLSEEGNQWSDYIGFGNQDNDNDKISIDCDAKGTKRNKPAYLPLRVKRVKGK